LKTPTMAETRGELVLGTATDSHLPAMMRSHVLGEPSKTAASVPANASARDPLHRLDRGWAQPGRDRLSAAKVGKTVIELRSFRTLASDAPTFDV